MENLKKASAKLYLLLFIVTVCIIITGLSGILGMRQMNNNIRTLNADRMIPLEQLSKIRLYYTTGILSIPEGIESNRLQRSEAISLIEKNWSAANENWDAYLHTNLTDSESDIIQESKPLKRNADSSISNYLRLIRDPAIPVDDKIDDALFMSVTSLMNRINDLSDLQVATSKEISAKNELLFRDNDQQLILLILVSILTSFIVGYYIITDNRRFIRNLRNTYLKMEAAENKFRTFIRYAGDAIMILDTEMKIMEVNDYACKLLGYDASEFPALHLNDIIAREEQTDISLKLGQIGRSGSSIHKRKFRKKDGSYVSTEVTVRKLEDTGFITIIRDISEREKAEKQIRESEEKYRYLFQHSPACIIIWNLEDLRILEVNETVISKYGYSKEEWEHMTVLQYRPESDHDSIRSFAQTMLREDKSIERNIWTHLKKNGDEMKMDISSHKIIYNGHTAILSLANDITEQSKAEAALRKSEERFRMLVDHAADAIVMVTDNGDVFDANKHASELLLYSKEELTKMNAAEFHLTEVRKELPALWQNLRRSNTLTDIRKLLKKDGTTVEVEISRRMLPDGSGAIAIVRDITERKKAEERIRRSEANYRHLFELSPAPMWVINETTTGFIQVNKAGIEKYGYSETEFMQMKMTDIYPDFSNSKIEYPESPNSIFHECHHIRKTGEILITETACIPMDINGERSLLIIAIDITEKTLYEQRLSRAAIKAQEDERYEIGSELHDNVCQILATSMMFLSLFRKALPPEALGLYEQASGYINQASTEIRNLSHQLAPSFLDETTLEEAFHNLLKIFNTENKYDIELYIDKEVKALQINQELILNLYRILQEQLRNIAKHASASLVNVSVSIHQKMLQMSISDDGKGFDPSIKKGGIGIANMKRRAKLFSGTFKIESSPGNGCDVTVEVPL